MANKKISSLPEATVLAQDTLLGVVTNDLDHLTTKKIYLTNMFKWIDYVPEVSYSGGSIDYESLNVSIAKYILIGKRLELLINAEIIKGSGNRPIILFSLPFDYYNGIPLGIGYNNLSSIGEVLAVIGSSNNKILVYPRNIINNFNLVIHISYEVE